jgi:hypothetical protein
MQSEASCTFCGARTFATTARVRDSGIGELLGGGAPTGVVFVDSFGGEQEVLAPNSERLASACSSCGRVVTFGEQWLTSGACEAVPSELGRLRLWQSPIERLAYRGRASLQEFVVTGDYVPSIVVLRSAESVEAHLCRRCGALAIRAVAK